MRRQLLVILLCFAAFAVTGFAAPLAATSSTARTQRLWFDRYVDAEWFADLAVHAMATGDRSALDTEMRRYHDLYSDRVLVVDARGGEFANTGVDTADARTVASLAAVRSNRHAVQPPHRLRPWDSDSMRITHPIGAGMQVGGAVLIEASTVRAKHDILDRWVLISLGTWTALLLCTGVALVVTRWVLRPLARLSGAVTALARTLPRPAAAAAPTVITRNYGGPPEVRELAGSFEAMAQAVGEAVDAQRQLVADTAHAIRNPLTALAIRLDQLGRSIPEQAVLSLRRAVAQVERLQAVLDGMLRLAAAETPAGFGAGQADSDFPSRCEAVRIIDDRVESWQPACAAAGVTVTSVLPPREVEVAVPEDALVQILDVLLSNSCRYAGAGARAEVALRVAGDAAVVSVTDDGAGVAPDELDKLTTRFYRGTAAAAGGTGLGLPIAAASAQRHGGALTVSAVHPHGLRASVRLPLGRVAD
ncbi:sensor histidine kinase [Nocardia wallacei]|uniref:Signal transduction histidine-protein kinase/phosphatase MprB n=1 Tax=Nocardia wallacei TaxID=480035 RepID=A0A7G1KKF3_9NOCA|nr:HAMP domain-containing sensor histidine kinase [Nocardia wallacei]BCK55331.1 two-component sensor histidine kinase [Nocardia wallacei]